MKLFQILISLLFLGQLLSAQRWAPVGAEWHFESKYPWDNVYGYFYFKSVKDTFALGKNCKKIFVPKMKEWQCSSSRGAHFYDPILTYESNDSVYFIYYSDSSQNFQLFYAWNALKGDSYLVRNERFDMADTVLVRIDSTDQIVVNGKTLRRQFVTHIPNRGISPYNRIYIEGIGDLHYFFGTEAGLFGCDLPFPVGLRCYQDTSIGLYTNRPADSCDQEKNYISIVEYEKESINISPNPVTDILKIQTNFSNYTLIIYNQNGNIVYTDEVNTMVEELYLKYLNQGIYILELKTKDEVSHRMKLIKN